MSSQGLKERESAREREGEKEGERDIYNDTILALWDRPDYIQVVTV